MNQTLLVLPPCCTLLQLSLVQCVNTSFVFTCTVYFVDIFKFSMFSRQCTGDLWWLFCLWIPVLTSGEGGQGCRADPPS